MQWLKGTSAGQRYGVRKGLKFISHTLQYSLTNPNTDCLDFLIPARLQKRARSKQFTTWSAQLGKVL